MIFAIIELLLSIIVIVILYFKGTSPICASIERLEGKAVIVTGGTRGMGLHIAEDLAKRGARVIVASPFEDEAKQITNNNIVYRPLDLASFASVKAFANDILKTESQLDILVNNAGGFFDYITKDGYHATVQINYLSHFLLTLLLLPLLKKSNGGRIVNVSSLSHFLGSGEVDLKSKQKTLFGYYKDSKLFVALFTKKLANMLKGTNVIVNTADPGLVGTGIAENYLPRIVNKALLWAFSNLCKSAGEGAQTAIHCAVELNISSGGYYKDCQEFGASSKLRRVKLVEELWEESKRLLKCDVM